MTRLLLVGLAAVCLSGGGASAQVAGAGDRPEIVTTGHGEVTLPPDRAIVRVGVETRGATAAAASTRHATQLASATEALVRAGFPRDSIRREAYSVGPNYDYERDAKIIDYAAESTLRVTVNDLVRLGAIIDAVLAGGATDISGIEFVSDTADAARARALAKALAMARTDAEALARAAGGRLGPLLSATTDPSAGFFRFSSAMQLSGVTVTGAAPIMREVSVSVRVQARWAFVATP